MSSALDDPDEIRALVAAAGAAEPVTAGPVDAAGADAMERPGA